jgi:transposase
MKNIKRKHTPQFKARVAIELLKEQDTINIICSKNNIHPSIASSWKDIAKKGIESLFIDKPTTLLKERDELIEELYKQIGQLKVEHDWLKKKVTSL